MNKYVKGVLLGACAGIIDVIPMIFMKLTWDANFSAFSMWVVIGFLLSSIDLKINGIIEGLLVSFLVLLPSAIIIGWSDPKSILPIIMMTTILGASLGFSISKIKK